MSTQWVMKTKDNSVIVSLFLNYDRPSETGGMDSGCSKVIAQGRITTNLLDLKRDLWDSVKKNYQLGDFKE